MKTPRESMAEVANVSPEQVRAALKRRGTADLQDFARTVRPVVTSSQPAQVATPSSTTQSFDAKPFRELSRAGTDLPVGATLAVTSIYITDSGIPVLYNFNAQPA